MSLTLTQSKTISAKTPEKKLIYLCTNQQTYSKEQKRSEFAEFGQIPQRLKEILNRTKTTLSEQNQRT